jgi:hypothetical protein
MPPKLTRRDLVRSAPVVLASSATQLPAASPKDQSARIQLDASINFNDPEIFTFVFDPKSTHLDHGPILSDDDRRTFDVISNSYFVVGSKDQDLYGAKREYYSIRQDNRETGEVSAVVLYKQPTVLTIKSVLLVAKIGVNGMTADLKTRIIKGFSEYTAGKDPLKFADTRMGLDVSPDMFEIRTAYSLDKKIANPVEFDVSQRKRLFDLYSGTISGIVYGVGNGNETQSLSAYLKEKNASVSDHPIHDEVLTQIPSHTVDPLHQKELLKADPKASISTKTEEAAVDVLLDADDGGLDPTTCHLKGHDKRRIAAVFGWPEFKVEWVPVRVKIGCVSMTLWLPKLSFRLSDLVLFACVRYEQNLGQAFVSMTLGCMVSSALSAMVVGVIASFALAMTTYLTLFNTCIANQIRCLVPDLILLVESTNWT